MHTRYEDPVVVGISPDGVPVAAEVARALEAPLDLLLLEPVGAPSNPEHAIGAVAEGEAGVVDDETVDRLGLRAEEVQNALARAKGRLGDQRSGSFFGRFRIAVGGRSVILVDDGLTDTHRARAAAQSLRSRGAARVTLAVPVAEPAAAQLLRRCVDDVVCVRMRERMLAVEQGYEDATPTSEEEVRALMSEHAGAAQREVTIESSPGVLLHGELTVPWGAYARGVVAFATDSSRFSPPDLKIAVRLHQAAIATLRLDLLRPYEDIDPARVVDEELLAGRLLAATRWLRRQPETAGIAIGYLGAGIGAAAALLAAAQLKAGVCAVVSNSGRVDLAAERLEQVLAPVLLIVSDADVELVELNRAAERRLPRESELVVLPDTSHPFDEPGALDEVARLTADWFTLHLGEPAPEIEGDKDCASARGGIGATVPIAPLR
jgi:putative phosphoribosyl transferase